MHSILLQMKIKMESKYVEWREQGRESTILIVRRWDESVVIFLMDWIDCSRLCKTRFWTIGAEMARDKYTADVRSSIPMVCVCVCMVRLRTPAVNNTRQENSIHNHYYYFIVLCRAQNVVPFSPSHDAGEWRWPCIWCTPTNGCLRSQSKRSSVWVLFLFFSFARCAVAVCIYIVCQIEHIGRASPIAAATGILTHEHRTRSLLSLPPLPSMTTASTWRKIQCGIWVAIKWRTFSYVVAHIVQMEAEPYAEYVRSKRGISIIVFIKSKRKRHCGVDCMYLSMDRNAGAKSNAHPIISTFSWMVDRIRTGEHWT